MQRRSSTTMDHQTAPQLPGQILPSTRIAGSRRGAKKGSVAPGAVPARPQMPQVAPTQAPPTQQRNPQGGRDKLGLGMAMKFGKEIREARQKQQRDKVHVATKLQALFRGNGGRAVAMEALGASLRRRALEGRRTDAAVSMQAWARGSRARVLVASRRTAAKSEQSVPMPGGVVGEIWSVFRGIAGVDCRPGDSANLVSVADFMKGMNMVATVSVFLTVCV